MIIEFELLVTTTWLAALLPIFMAAAVIVAKVAVPVRVGLAERTTDPDPVVVAKAIWLELFVASTLLGESGTVIVVPLMVEKVVVPDSVGPLDMTNVVPVPV